MNLLDSQSNYGLLHTDFSPKPAFTQLKNLLAMIGSSAPAQVTPVGFRLAGDTTDARALVLQQADRRYALVLWRTASVWDRVAKRRCTVAPRRWVVTIPDATAVSTGNPATGTAFTPGRAERRERDGRRRRRPAHPRASRPPRRAPPPPPPAGRSHAARRPARRPRTAAPTRPPTPRRPPTPPADPAPPADPPADPAPPAPRGARREHAGVAARRSPVAAPPVALLPTAAARRPRPSPGLGGAPPAAPRRRRA